MVWTFYDLKATLLTGLSGSAGGDLCPDSMTTTEGIWSLKDKAGGQETCERQEQALEVGGVKDIIERDMLGRCRE